MKQEYAAKNLHPYIKFFLLGALLELFLIACRFLPESWLAVQIQNVTLVVHVPLLILLESGLGQRAITAIPTLLFGFAVMSVFWGLLVYLLVKGMRLLLEPLNHSQRNFVRLGAGAVGLVGLVWAGSVMLPQVPRPFESSPVIKSVVDANNAFALDLYQKLKVSPGDLFFSPCSVSSLLAMTCAGARGQTEMEMTNLLHFGLPPDQLNTAFRTLTERLDGLRRWNRIELKCANSLWCQKDHPFTEAFLKTIRMNYSADARLVDFNKSPAAAAEEINRWIAEQTKHRIPGGIAPGQITVDTRMAVGSAIYFKGKWLSPFKQKDTQPSSFHVATNESVTVPMMRQSARFKHAIAEDNSVEMLEMPYSGRDLSMVILLPGRNVPGAEPDNLNELEQKLTAENLQVWLRMLDGKKSHNTTVRLPRFKTASYLNLMKDLKSLGMASAFSEKADFSGMDSSNNLYLSDVFLQAFVEVNETGTEATAMTFSRMAPASLDDRFIVDHPFIFLIRDNGSGSILFLGRMIDPSK